MCATIMQVSHAIIVKKCLLLFSYAKCIREYLGIVYKVMCATIMQALRQVYGANIVLKYLSYVYHCHASFKASFSCYYCSKMPTFVFLYRIACPLIALQWLMFCVFNLWTIKQSYLSFIKIIILNC